jgi:hypothetical protein
LKRIYFNMGEKYNFSSSFSILKHYCLDSYGIW